MYRAFAEGFGRQVGKKTSTGTLPAAEKPEGRQYFPRQGIGGSGDGGRGEIG